jgi:hypothetical protein
MTNRALLMVTSLSMFLLFSIHWAQDVVFGIDRVGPQSFTIVVIMVVGLTATLLLSDRVAGLITILVASLLSVGVTMLHLRGQAVVRLASTGSGGWFLWVLVMLGSAGAFGVVLSARGLWLRLQGQIDAKVSGVR